jgi:hypothetical protein
MQRLVEDGYGLSELAERFGVSKNSISSRLRYYGLRVRPDVRRREQSEQGKRRWQDRPDIAAKMAERRRTPESRAKHSAGAHAMWERRLRWCPPHLREEYRNLVWNKKFLSTEAKAMLQPEIDKFKRAHEGRLWLLKTGQAEIVEGVFRAK